jgi:hypothetical protein
MNTQDPNRGRKQLLLVAFLFALPVFVAVALAFAGWQPAGTRQHGVLLEPPQDFTTVVAADGAGERVVWNLPDGNWHVLVQLPPDCGMACPHMLDTLHRVWSALSREAAKAKILLVGTPDAATIAAMASYPEIRAITLSPNPLPAPARPAPVADTGVPSAPLTVWLVDPNGWLVMRYDAGFDPSGLRKDLKKLIR